MDGKLIPLVDTGYIVVMRKREIMIKSQGASYSVILPANIRDLQINGLCKNDGNSEVYFRLLCMNMTSYSDDSRNFGGEYLGSSGDLFGYDLYFPVDLKAESKSIRVKFDEYFDEKRVKGYCKDSLVFDRFISFSNSLGESDTYRLFKGLEEVYIGEEGSGFVHIPLSPDIYEISISPANVSGDPFRFSILVLLGDGRWRY